MSHLTIVSGQEIAQQNIERLYRFPKSYTATAEYLEHYNGALRNTLLSVLNYVKDKNLIIDKHRYEFILDTGRLTYKVRHKIAGRSTSNRHINLLCAMGFFKKVYQSRDKDILLEANKDFLEKSKSRRPINVFSFHAYTEKNLQAIEERSKQLRNAGITSGNISYNQLVLNGLEEIANEVYFANDRAAPQKKQEEAEELFQVLEMLCNDNGYATRDQIKENLTFYDTEIDKLLRIYKLQIQEKYKYSKPTNTEMQQYGLKDQRYIYRKREEE